jgi:PAS domain S-box-containing protein/putative nucleotidyltransferase with HDIG domain
VEVSLRLLPDGALQGIVRDLTARKQAEAEIQLLADVFTYSQMATAISSPDGQKFRLVNAAFAHLHGYAASELEGTPIAAIFAPESRQTLPEHIQIAHREGFHSFEAVHLRQDGSQFPVQVDVTAVKEGRRLRYRIVNVQDISERQAVEASMQRQIQQLAALRAIDLAISATLDERVTFSVLLDQVVTQLGVDAAAVLKYNPDFQTLEYAASRGFRSDGIRRTKLGWGTGLAGQAIQRGKGVTFCDLRQTNSQFLRAQALAQEDFIAYHGVPLLAKGQVKGVLEVFHRKLPPIDPAWGEFLEALGGQAAIALDNLSLYEDLQRNSRDLARAYDATLEGWARALELRDGETEGHSQRVTNLTLRIATRLGFGDLENLRRGTLLHDIGKMGIPDHILLKPGPLTPDEWEVMRRHPRYAYEMLSPIPFLRAALDIPYAHHERWDGSGYPRGLRGEQIPLAARIFMVVDVWDALRNDRPYRGKWPETRIVAYLQDKSGTHFDPEVVQHFLRIMAEEDPQA